MTKQPTYHLYNHGPITLEDATIIVEKFREAGGILRSDRQLSDTLAKELSGKVSELARTMVHGRCTRTGEEIIYVSDAIGYGLNHLWNVRYSVETIVPTKRLIAERRGIEGRMDGLTFFTMSYVSPESLRSIITFTENTVGVKRMLSKGSYWLHMASPKYFKNKKLRKKSEMFLKVASEDIKSRAT